MATLAVLGAGGTSVLMRDIAMRTELFDDYCFLDDDDTKVGTELEGTPVFGALAAWERLPGNTLFISSLYAPRSKGAIAARVDHLAIPEHRWATVVDPTAMISQSAHLGRGVLIGPHATLEPGTSVGNQSTVAAGCIISHDTRIGRGVYCASSSALGSRVLVNDHAFLGIGCRIMNRLQIGTGATVGMGAVVTRDTDPWTTVAGNPARVFYHEPPEQAGRGTA